MNDTLLTTTSIKEQTEAFLKMVWYGTEHERRDNNLLTQANNLLAQISETLGWSNLSWIQNLNLYKLGCSTTLQG